MAQNTPGPKRLLRRLKISDVSAVDRGAGRGVRVMLAKRAPEKEREMQSFAEFLKGITEDGETINKVMRDIRKADLTPYEREEALSRVHEAEKAYKFQKHGLRL
jgi:uncharacterized membrane protein